MLYFLSFFIASCLWSLLLMVVVFHNCIENNLFALFVFLPASIIISNIIGVVFLQYINSYFMLSAITYFLSLFSIVVLIFSGIEVYIKKHYPNQLLILIIILLFVVGIIAFLLIKKYPYIVTGFNIIYLVACIIIISFALYREFLYKPIRYDICIYNKNSFPIKIYPFEINKKHKIYPKKAVVEPGKYLLTDYLYTYPSDNINIQWENLKTHEKQNTSVYKKISKKYFKEGYPQIQISLENQNYKVRLP